MRQQTTRLLQRILAPFEDPAGLYRPLWRDYSRYDLNINLDVAWLNGVNGAAFRYAMGWGGTDDTFPRRWEQAGFIEGMYRTGYSVLYPSLDVEQQCDHWFALMPKIDTIPRVLDAELQDGQTDAKVGQSIWQACEIIKSYDGVYPIIYSRYMLLDRWLRYWSQEDVESKYYWGARYLWDRTREHPGPPYGSMVYTTIPDERWILQQTADKKAPFPGETERSTIVDWDRWLHGDVDTMRQWISDTWGETPDDHTHAGLEDEIDATKAYVIELNDKYETHLAELHNGDDVTPPPLPEFIAVQAIEKFALSKIVGHDKACEGQTPPGKPIMEPPNDNTRIVIKEGTTFRVVAQIAYSCKDDPTTPEIHATGMIPYYAVADYSGEVQYAPKNKTKRV